MRKRIKDNIICYLFLAPWLVFFIIFMLIPFVSGLVYSLYDYDYVDMKSVGLDNYKYIFSDEIFLRSIINTIIIAFTVVILTICIGLFLSQLIVRQSKRLQAALKAAIYIPAVTSSVAIVAVWKWILNPAYGISASISINLGIIPIDWFGQAGTAMSVVSLMVLTFALGQPVVLYTVAMMAIPKTYYEVADIDGASNFRKFFSITIPLIKPTTLYIVITSTIAMMQVFEVPMLLTSGGPQYATTTILLLLYKTAFEFTKFGRAAAMGVVLFIIIGAVAVFQFRLMKSDIKY